MSSPDGKVIWTPQPGPQTAFLMCPYKEVLYGGAAGGGKSDALIGDFSAGVEQFGGAWHGVLARRSYPQLAEIEKRCLEIFGPHYGSDSYRRSTKTWWFRTEKGLSSLKLASIDDDIKVLDHQGQQYSWIGMDEATQWPDDGVLEYLRTRTRSPKGSPTYIRLTANPGGVGHDWVKRRFRIGEVEPMQGFEFRDSKGNAFRRVFIPAKLSDNIILMKNDPAYEGMLDGIADPVLRRALRDGDWDIAAGAAFSDFNKDVHVQEFEVPPGVRLWRSCDWGYDRPYGCIWFFENFDGVVHIPNELYGMGAKPNVGVRHAPDLVADKIAEIELRNQWEVYEAYLDPQCWAQEGGETIFQMLGGHKMRWRPWPKGPGSRYIQKQLVHKYLQITNGEPRIKIHPRCKHLIRTMISLPLDRRNPEDVDTHAEDHLYDALRGGLSGHRPQPRRNANRNILMDYDDDARMGEPRMSYGSW